MVCQCHVVKMKHRENAVLRAMEVSYAARIVFAAALLVFATHGWAKDTSTICQCRAPGGDMRDLGTVECVNIVGTRKMVRCEMSTNTPYWKDIEQVNGCPDA